jgi:hypothetical protein
MNKNLTESVVSSGMGNVDPSGLGHFTGLGNVTGKSCEVTKLANTGWGSPFFPIIYSHQLLG